MAPGLGALPTDPHRDVVAAVRRALVTRRIDQELKAIHRPESTVLTGIAEDVVDHVHAQVQVLLVPQEAERAGEVIRSVPVPGLLRLVELPRAVEVEHPGPLPVGLGEIAVDGDRALCLGRTDEPADQARMRNHLACGVVDAGADLIEGEAVDLSELQDQALLLPGREREAPFGQIEEVRLDRDCVARAAFPCSDNDGLRSNPREFRAPSPGSTPGCCAHQETCG
jgi:hypothetical protein